MVSDPTAEELSEMCRSLEQVELDSATVGGEVYGKLLAIYLIQVKISYRKIMSCT